MSDLPNDFPTEEELQAQFEQPEDQEQPIAASGEPEPEAAATAPPPPDEPADPELEVARNFLAWTKRNPDGWNQLLEWEKGNNVIVPRQSLERTYSQPVDEEPTDYYSEDYLRGLRKDITELRASFDQRLILEARAAVDEGVNRFKTKHADLEAADLGQVVQFVYDRRLLETIPDDLSSPAKSSAVEQRFEEAYRSVFYDRSRQQATREVVSDLSARRRAASSSSSATSIPRVEPEPSTPQEKKAAYVDAIAQALAEDGGS